MTISAQSLSGTDLAAFKNKLDTATPAQRAELERDIAEAVKTAIANLPGTSKSAVEGEIAKQVKAKLGL